MLAQHLDGHAHDHEPVERATSLLGHRRRMRRPPVEPEFRVGVSERAARRHAVSVSRMPGDHTASTSLNRPARDMYTFPLPPSSAMTSIMLQLTPERSFLQMTVSNVLHERLHSERIALSKVVELPNEEAVSIRLSSGQPFYIVFSNRSTYCLKFASTRLTTQPNFNPRFPVPTTCRNCNSGSCDDCFTSKQYAPIFSVSCDSPAFYIRLYLEDTATGKWYYADTTTPTAPDCNYSGSWVCLEA
jgi:hypothetical protein